MNRLRPVLALKAASDPDGGGSGWRGLLGGEEEQRRNRESSCDIRLRTAQMKTRAEAGGKTRDGRDGISTDK